MSRGAALITGGSSGIGFAIAEMLAEMGYDLTLVGRREDKLQRARQALAESGAAVEAVAANVAEEDAAAAVLAAHRERWGRLDVLVNNAGVGVGAAVAEITARELDLSLAVNLRSVVFFCREATELLRSAAAERGTAMIVNTSSLSGKAGRGTLGAYSAAKFAVVGFTQALHQELAPEGVKCTVLCPGIVDTPMTDLMKDEVDAAAMIQPRDIALQVRCLLEMSPACIVPEVEFIRPGGGPFDA